MFSADDVVRLYQERKKARSAVVNAAEEVRAAYNGDIVLPSPELRPGQKAAVANLIQLGIDQTSMRIASTQPTIFVPPMRPGIRKSEDEAAVLRRAGYGWWKANDYLRKTARRARHLVAYSATPVLIRPWAEQEIPRWYTRNPLGTYPADMDDDDMEPTDCIFCYRRSLSWLKARYPDRLARLYKGKTPRPDDMFEVLEYVDGEQTVVVVAARQQSGVDRFGGWDVSTVGAGVSKAEMLEWTANRAEGTCPVVMPGRVTLDRPLGQFDGALGLFIKQARLEALEEIGIQRGVLPEQWIMSDTQGGTAKVITWADAREGIIGEISGGKIETVRLDPSVQAPTAIDRTERAIRVEGRIPAEYGGESASNVRTDRRGNSIMAATVDHTIAEAQQALAASAEKELAIGVKIAKAWFGEKRKSFWVNWPGASGPADYVPNRDFTSAVAFVRYALPGTDVNGLAVSMGQRLGEGTIDRLTAMELDPLVDDPQQVLDRLLRDQLQQAAVGGFQQQIAQGGVSPEDLVWFADQVLAHKLDFFEAYAEVHRRAQERQSSTVNPAEPGSPEAQPGLAQPGAGAEAGTAQQIGPSPNQQGLGQLLRSLHAGGTQPTATQVPVG